MIKTKPNTKKELQDRGKGQFFRRQYKSSKFIHKNEKPFRRCEDINNELFDLVIQGYTELYAKFLKAFYYIGGIKFQKNGSNVQYSVNNL